MVSKEKIEMLVVILTGCFVLAALISPMLPSGGNSQFVGGEVIGGQQGETVICTDSDGGLNFDVRGTCTDVASGSEYTDYCDGPLLNEYRCAENGCISVQYNCPHGCLNGVCLPQLQT